MRRSNRTVSTDGMTDGAPPTSRAEDSDNGNGNNNSESLGNLTRIIQDQPKELTEQVKPALMAITDDINIRMGSTELDPERSRYPYCIVWTPLPLITWIIPLIGHMGIAYSSGVIRDFAGPYYVSEDHMSFGEPTKYWVMDPDLVQGGPAGWDRGIYDASEEYKTHMHNICCDNCHSHCAYALNLMNYKGSKSWNMVWLWWFMLLHGKYVNFMAFLKTWGPFTVFATIILILTIWRM